MGYSFRLAARVLLYALSHRQDHTYPCLCYTSRGALAGTRNSSMGPPWRIDPTIHRNSLTNKTYQFLILAPQPRQLMCMPRTACLNIKLTKKHQSTHTFWAVVPIWTWSSIGSQGGIGVWDRHPRPTQIASSTVPSRDTTSAVFPYRDNKKITISLFM